MQRRLTEDLIVEVGYVGNKGTHLTMFINENTALPGPGDPESAPAVARRGSYQRDEQCGHVKLRGAPGEARKALLEGTYFPR